MEPTLLYRRFSIYILVLCLLLAFIAHVWIASFITNLHAKWQYGARSQKECGNGTMEMDTARHNVHSFLKTNSHGTTAPLAFLIIVVIVAFPAAALVMRNLAQSLIETISQYPLEGRSASPTIWALSVIFLFSVTSLVMVRTSLNQEDMVDKWFVKTQYERYVNDVKSLLPKLKNCSVRDADTSKEDACKGNKLYQNIAQSILQTDQLPSMEVAKEKLDAWIKSQQSDEILRYIRFNRYDMTSKQNALLPNEMTDYDALQTLDVPAQSLEKLSSLAFADPSENVQGAVRKWQAYLIVAFAAFAFVPFHAAYLTIDHTTMLMVFIVALIAVVFARYVQRYQY